jgi:purine-binding chemotaxis protein CheW
MAEAAPDRQREILVFTLDGQRYALWAADVRELLRAVAMVPLPGSPPIVEGAIDLRGRVVPVLDLRRRFGLPAKALDPGDHLIVAAAGARLVAIRADRALDLVNLEVAGRRSTVDFDAGAYVAGVARLPDGLAVIHDLRTFLEASEGATLDRALAAAGAPA